MARSLVACIAWCIAALAHAQAYPPPGYDPEPEPAAFTPHNGLWWNPAESGSGYQIQTSAATLIVTIYAFKASGEPVYYLAAGPRSNGGRSFVATLDRYRGGQCISCPYVGAPALDGNDGTVRFEFQSTRSATVYLPGGRVTTIQPFDF